LKSCRAGRENFAGQPAIAENVTLILPLHRELDAIRENANKANAIGTTQRGIGPAYEDKVGRRAIRLMDLADPQTLPHKIDRLLTHHNASRRGLNLPEVDGAEILKDLSAIAPKVLPFADQCGTCSTTSAAKASASCSKARRARCSMSITALILMSPRPTPWRRRQRPAQVWALGRSVMCSASARPTPRASGRGRSPPS
jgi:hypothetical protein